MRFVCDYLAWGGLTLSFEHSLRRAVAGCRSCRTATKIEWSDSSDPADTMECLADIPEPPPEIQHSVLCVLSGSYHLHPLGILHHNTASQRHNLAI